MHFFFSFTRLNVTGKKRLLHKTQDQFLLDGHIFSHACDSLIEKCEITESGNVAALARRTMETGCFCAAPSFSGNLLQLLRVCVCVWRGGINKTR